VTHHRGTLLIHAGKTKPHSSWMKDSSPRQDGSGYLVRCEKLRKSVGVILGTVELVDILTEKEALKKFPAQEMYMEQVIIEGPYCWIFESPKLFKEPIPCAGQLMLWDFDIQAHERQTKSDAG